MPSAVSKPVDWALLAGFDAGLQILDALVAVAFQLANLVPRQVVDVGQVVDEALRDTNNSACLMPKPAMSIASRPTKYSTARTSCSGQALLMQ
jgi:hypothetical protein